MTSPDPLASLRRRLAALEAKGKASAGAIFSSGLAELDAALGGGLGAGLLHEVLAEGTADAASAEGFAAGLALRAGGKTRRPGAGRALLWVRQDGLDAEVGRLYGPGLCEFGLDPARLVMVRAADPAGVLRAGEEAIRCPELGAVLIELWGDSRALDLTATRRLALAAERSGVTAFLLRIAAKASPSAAATRWAVRAAASRPLDAGAPGPPVFAVTLLRHRAGPAGHGWLLEWNRDRKAFQPPLRAPEFPAEGLRPPLSLPLAPLPASRTAAAGPAAGARDLRRTG